MVLVGKPEGKIWEDNIKTDLKDDGRAYPGFIWLTTGASGELL
jgi:hypothetical protein